MALCKVEIGKLQSKHRIYGENFEVILKALQQVFFPGSGYLSPFPLLPENFFRQNLLKGQSRLFSGFVHSSRYRGFFMVPSARSGCA